MINKLHLLALASLGLASAVHAETVGRTEFQLPTDQWTLLTSYDREVKLDGGMKSIPLRTKVFKLLESSGEMLALLMVTSTEGGHAGGVQWQNTCPASRPKVFAKDYDSNRGVRTTECLLINSNFSPPKFFSNTPEIQAALEASGKQLFPIGVFVGSSYGAQGGSILKVNFISKKNFIGTPTSTLATTEVDEVPARLIAWGEQLQQATKDAVLSMKGGLALPIVKFATVRPKQAEVTAQAQEPAKP